MNSLTEKITTDGFALAKNLFSTVEIAQILNEIERQQKTNANFRVQSEVFAIRCFLQEIPDLRKRIFTDKFQKLIDAHIPNARLIKSIYFNKPTQANWIVNWHQDLTVLVKEKIDTEGFTHWTTKGEYVSVQPPIGYSHRTITFRIHLDDCTQENGALRVIPGSHTNRQNFKDLPDDFFSTETICEANAGDVLLMKPLLWHSSRRTSNHQNRRIIHLEFCNLDLPDGLTWQEQ